MLESTKSYSSLLFKSKLPILDDSASFTEYERARIYFEGKREIWESNIDDHAALSTTDRKLLQKILFNNLFGSSKQIEEQKQKICETQNTLIRFLDTYQSESVVYDFGSNAAGVPNITSDIDLIVFTTASLSDEWIYNHLDEGGIFIDPSRSPVSFQRIREDGGMIRSNGISYRGVEVGFHLFSLESAEVLTTAFSKGVQKFVDAPHRSETLMDIQSGESLTFMKDPDYTQGYRKFEGRTFRGFYPDAMLKAEVIYDGLGRATEIRNLIYRRAVGAFLYHNKMIERGDHRRSIKHTAREAFPQFLATHFYGSADRFSETKYLEMLSLYISSLEMIREQLR